MSNKEYKVSQMKAELKIKCKCNSIKKKFCLSCKETQWLCTFWENEMYDFKEKRILKPKAFYSILEKSKLVYLDIKKQLDNLNQLIKWMKLL